MEPEGLPPAPPSSAPPLPPSPELLRGTPAHVPLTPMMDFLQRRLEVLERELSLEREKARSAQGMLQQQEALSTEVESRLKGLSDQLRREKNEREGDEERSRAAGRIDALEKRLDEMHQSWASLLREAVVQRQAGEKADSAALAELKSQVSALASAVETLGSGLSQVPLAVPELRTLAGQLSADARRAELSIGERLSEISGAFKDELAAWQRRAALEGEKSRERLEALAREREAMGAALEQQNHGLRQEFLRERIQRESALEARIAEALEAMSGVKGGLSPLRDGLGALGLELKKLVETLTQAPPAKDAEIASLQSERAALLKSLQSRGDALQRHLAERREIEASLGESLLEARRAVDEERRRALELATKSAGLEAEAAAHKDRLELSRLTARQSEERAQAMAAERDKLAKTLASEAGRVREEVQARLELEDRLKKRFEDLEARLSGEILARSETGLENAHLKARLAGLSEQITKALQEKDQALSRGADWEGERAKLLATLKEKDEVISMLNSTFQGLLKKTD